MYHLVRVQVTLGLGFLIALIAVKTLLRVVSSHVFPKGVLVVERLDTVVTLVKTTSVGSHMVQRHKTSVELLVAIVALELILFHVSLDVPLQGSNLGELFLTKFTVQRLDEALFFLVDFLVLCQF